MKNVLLLTDVNFWERSSGNRMRIYHLIEYLAPLVKLTVVNTGPASQNIESILTRTFQAEFFVLEKTKHLSSTGYGRKLKAILKNRCFDAVIIEYIHTSYFINYLKQEAMLILDAHDIISERAEAFKKFGYSKALYELSSETEKEIFGVYDHIMVLCPADIEIVTTMAGPGKAMLCPHPLKPVIHPVRKKVTNIVFVASGYLPNCDAINWFLKNCWPQITEKYVVTLQIFGTVCGAVDPTAHNNINLNGFAGDIHAVYDQADIVINPVRFGAGLKIKNVEALGHGRPLVTTTHGARGIEIGIGKAFLIANKAADFVQAINSLIQDAALRKKMSKQAHQLITRHFSEKTCFKPLADKLGSKT